MQTVTGSAQGMVSQANEHTEGKRTVETPDSSSYVERHETFPDLLLPEELLFDNVWIDE